MNAEADEDASALKEQVRALRLQLHEIQQGSHELIAMLAHELRTPLGAILMWAHVLRMGRQSDQEPALEAIEASAQAQSTLIASLLDLTRAMAGRLRIDAMPVNFGAVARLSAEEIRANAANIGVALNVSVPELPLPVHGDAHRLREMVSTLVNHAIRASKSGGTVEVTVTAVAGVARLMVNDAGPRLMPDEQAHLFTPFRLGGEAKGRAPGSLGLEMPLVRFLAELHGGTVMVESPGPGPGTALVLQIPLSSQD